ncbi:adenosine receptor A3 [Denticeps clupeoides]|uniref:adenosine receptor A3 n=1 Tax=Denticeps clupeoides TaxID=299321 RepID=UPI0010A52CB4|nr:adenosine receptor A3-like [Denticeps clupeoides]
MAVSALVYALLLIVSSVCSVFGNSMLLLLVLLNKNLRSDTLPLTISFCLCDLGLGLSTMPFGVYNSLAQPDHHGDGPLCQASAFIFILLQLASIHSLTWTTVDKFTEICFALSYTTIFTEQRTWAVLGVVWLYCILNATLPLVGFGKYAYIPGRFICAPSFQRSCLGFNLLFVVVGIIAPILIMCCMYAYIMYVAKKQARRGTFICNEQHCFYVPANNYLRSSIVMLATVVCLLVCWLPYIVICFYETLTGHESSELVSAVATWLALSTAAVNPWINSMTQTRYRVALRRSLGKIRQMFQQPVKGSHQSTANQPGDMGDSCTSGSPPVPLTTLPPHTATPTPPMELSSC